MENKNANTQKKKMNPVLSVILKLLLTVVVLILIFFAGSVIALILASEDIHLTLTYVAGYLLPALLLPVIWLKKRKKYMKIWLAIAVLCVVVLGANFAMVKYDESIRIDTWDYESEEAGADVFVFIVHKDNPVDNLTTEQLRGIYSGEITNWKDVGGENKKIKAYQGEADSASQSMMESFMGEVSLMDAPTEMGYGYLYAWGEQVSSYRNKPDSIGYYFKSCVEDNPEVKMLSVDGAAPTQENIENGSYPIIVPISAAADEETAE